MFYQEIAQSPSPLVVISCLLFRLQALWSSGCLSLGYLAEVSSNFADESYSFQIMISAGIYFHCASTPCKSYAIVRCRIPLRADVADAASVLVGACALVASAQEPHAAPIHDEGAALRRAGQRGSEPESAFQTRCAGAGEYGAARVRAATC